MSIMIDKLKQAGNVPGPSAAIVNSEKKAEKYTGLIMAPHSETVPRSETSQHSEKKTIALPRWGIASLVAGLVVSVTLAVVFGVSSGARQKNLSQEVRRLFKEQRDQIHGLETKLADVESRQKKSLLNLETKFSTVNANIIQAGKRLDQVEVSSDRANRSIKDLRLTAENMSRQYSDLRGDMKALRLLTVKESAATVVPERNGYGKNN